MLKITKFTDYSLVVLCHLIKQHNVSLEGNTAPNIQSANEIAREVKLQLPTVSKVLKLMVKSGFVRSRRGSVGGYELAINPKDITVKQVIESLEGPVELTTCSKLNNTYNDSCEHINDCMLSQPWQTITTAVNNVLNNITINDLAYNQIDL